LGTFPAVGIDHRNGWTVVGDDGFEDDPLEIDACFDPSLFGLSERDFDDINGGVVLQLGSDRTSTGNVGPLQGHHIELSRRAHDHQGTATGPHLPLCCIARPMHPRRRVNPMTQEHCPAESARELTESARELAKQ
jgi:hypothetical protein